MKIYRSVVRNQAYPKSNFSIRERHNERLNESYGNGDILPERSVFNVHFKSCDGYEQTFNRMVDDGIISLRGLKSDAKVFDELIFDVNSAYFENNGGYDYAKKFFAEAYQLAIKEAGGEEYILSAVLHADERNKALSEQYGHDIFHYHLHVVYVPVVDKEIKWSKRCKDPNLVGTVKETIKQVSHSKKWPRFNDEQGRFINSYSLLQDHFYEHMKSAGYTDFERGERGSTAKHLSVLEYKTRKETERATTLAIKVKQKQETAIALDKKVEKSRERLNSLSDKISIKTKVTATIAEINAIGKPTLLGGVTVTADEMTKLKTLAKKCVTIEDKTAELKQKLKVTQSKLEETQKQLDEEIKKRPSFRENLSISKFIAAMRRAPKR
ncbi:MAG: plasmid recombination protein [Lachnospiraceae bacterium]|nr:plasmid recombination protein [Lachnospiraceae bacterium]